MFSLQAHQLRVAAVAKTICEKLENSIDSKSILTACLLHDMGNILKFDLNLFPQFLEPEGLEYWQKVKQEFEEKYGSDEYKANIAIAEEFKVKPKILDLISSIGFEKIEKYFLVKNLEKMICEYADCRVAPTGIVSLDERLFDLEKRYGSRHFGQKDKHMRQKYYDLERQSEKYIFEKIAMKPEEISEEALNDTIQELKLFKLS